MRDGGDEEDKVRLRGRMRGRGKGESSMVVVESPIREARLSIDRMQMRGSLVTVDSV